MSKFAIAFNPPLPSTVPIDPPLGIGDLNAPAIITRYDTEHNVVYSIDEKKFCYYPSSILTVLNDIHLEWMCIRERRSHDVTLSGYTVLEAAFEKGSFQFFNPAWPPTPVGDRFDTLYLEDQFHLAIAAVWGLVQSIQNPG